MLQITLRSVVLVLVAVGLAACGGGGGGSNAITGPSYSGVDSPTAVTVDNSEAIGTAATDSASQIVNTSTAMDSSPLAVAGDGGGTIPTNELNQLIGDITKKSVAEFQSSNMPVGAVITYTELNQQNTSGGSFCGGSITVPDNVDPNSTTLDMTVTFNNLCYTDTVQTVVMNGTVRLIETQTNFTIIYSSFSVAIDGGEALTINATVSCDSGGSTCTVDYIGSDGVTYRVGNLSVFGNDTDGYSISATFYHPDHGSVSLTTQSNLYFDCPSQHPSAGTLSFAGEGGTSGSITFDTCTTYTWCYDLGDGSGPQCSSGAW